MHVLVAQYLKFKYPFTPSTVHIHWIASFLTLWLITLGTSSENVVATALRNTGLTQQAQLNYLFQKPVENTGWLLGTVDCIGWQGGVHGLGWNQSVTDNLWQKR